MPSEPDGKCSLATWSPKGNAIAFVKGNNLFVRRLDEDLTSDYYSVTPVTKDGGTELFYGIPDWVYEEEVFAGNSAMWWSEQGDYLAFLRTNETEVPEYPIQFFIHRPSGETPPPGLENYPELEFIKYPKAGAPNPVVHLRFYDVAKKEDFAVEIEGGFPDDDRLITEVVWVGSQKVLVRETNRESDKMRVVLIDVSTRSGKAVREVDVSELDGGWFEVVCSQIPWRCYAWASDPYLQGRLKIPDLSQQILRTVELRMGISTLSSTTDMTTLPTLLP